MNSVQMRFKTDLLTSLNRGKILSLTKAFPTVKLLEKAVVAVIRKKPGRIFFDCGAFSPLLSGLDSCI